MSSHERSVRYDPCGFFFLVIHLNIAFLGENKKRAKCKHASINAKQNAPIKVRFLFALAINLQKSVCQNTRAHVPLPHVFPPFAIRQSPTGRATLGSRTLSDAASLFHSLRWCKKDHSAPATSYSRLVLGAPFLVAAAPRVPSRNM